MDLRLVVVRILLRELFHGPRISLKAGAVIDFLVVGVHDRKRVEIVALPSRFRADALSLCNHGSALDEVFRGRRGVRIQQQA